MNTTILSKPLTPPQQRFVEAFVRYGNISKAIRISYPSESKNWRAEYQYQKGKRMLQNASIKDEIEDRMQVKEANANLGAKRIQAIIVKGKEHNALAASMFSIEQIDGKAKITQETKSEHVFVSYDLSGGNAGAIPQSVMDELNADDEPITEVAR